MTIWEDLRVNDVGYTVAEDDVGEDDLCVVDIHGAVRANTERDLLSVDRLDSGVGDVAGEDDGAGDGVVGQDAGEGFDAGVAEGGGSGLEGIIVGDEDGQVLNSVDSLYEVGRGKSTEGGERADLREL